MTRALWGDALPAGETPKGGICTRGGRGRYLDGYWLSRRDKGDRGLLGGGGRV